MKKSNIFKKGNIPWNKGKKGLYKHSEHTKNKIREINIGSKSHFWKGGKTKISDAIRNCFKYRQWRSDVFTRDNFTCQDCGGKKGGSFEAHHIKSISKIIEQYNIKTLKEALSCEELWNINNGRTLCKDCHKKTDGYANRKI